MVYKYYPPNENSLDAFWHQYFFFCNVEKLNDPYDTSFSLVMSEEFRQRLHLTDEAGDIMKKYATCSFARSNNNMALWAHYADSFKGFCLGFDESTFESMNDMYQARFIFQDVQYVDEIIDCNNPDATFHINNVYGNCETYKIRDCYGEDPKIADKFFTYLAFIKDRKTWENEEEIRIFTGKDLLERGLMPTGVSKGLNGYKINMPHNAIKSLIIGHNADKSIRECTVRMANILDIPVYITETKFPFRIDIKEYYL